MKPYEPHVIQPIMQVGPVDCAVATLAMYLGRPYRQVSEIAMSLVPTVHQRGLWTTEMVEIARQLRAHLTPRRVRSVADLDGRSAILCVRRQEHEHAVVLFQGVVINPADGQLWDLETWLTTHRWTVTGILTA